MMKTCMEFTCFVMSVAVKTSATDLRVHFKNTFEVVRSIKGMNLESAKRYLKAVIDRKRCIPITHFTGCIGRTSQAHEFGKTQGIFNYFTYK